MVDLTEAASVVEVEVIVVSEGLEEATAKAAAVGPGEAGLVAKTAHPRTRTALQQSNSAGFQVGVA